MKTMLTANIAAAPADTGGGAPTPPKAARGSKAPPESPGFKLEKGLPVPAAQRVGTSQSNWPFKDMEIGISFLMPVAVPDTIKDDKEREASFKEQARKLSNRVSGAIRRFKNNNEGYEFAIRTVNDDKLGHGVRVYRVEAAA